MKQIIPSRKFVTLFLLLCLSQLWIAPVTAQSAAQPETGSALSLSARAGFDSYYKSGYWLPVQVTASNDGPPLVGELRLTVGTGFGNQGLVYSAPITLPTQSHKRLTLYIYPSGSMGRLRVELVTENGRIAATTETNTLIQLTSDNLLYGVVSPNPDDLEFLETVTGSRPKAAVAFLEADMLPTTATAWRALDILIFQDTDTGTLSAAQQAALRQWLDSGGQLVITGGPGWQKTASAFTDLLPVTISGSESVADLPALRQVGGEFRDPGPYLVARSNLVRGELLLHQDGLPLLARHVFGNGRVYFLALDPGLAPLVDWDGRQTVWNRISYDTPIPPYWANGFQNSYAAATAVSSLPSLTLPSILGLILFLLIYTLTIGPINYLILKRRGQRELAWVSIPLLVVVFSGVAYLTGFQLKGNTVILNQMSLVYSRLESQNARVQSLVGLYSPRRGNYNLSFGNYALPHPFDRDNGDMSGSGNSDGLLQEGSDTTLLRHVRVDVSGMATFVADSYVPSLHITGQATLESTPENTDIILSLRLHNQEPFALENATVFWGERAISLGTIAPGEEKKVDVLLPAANSAASNSPGIPLSSTIGPGVVTAPLSAGSSQLLVSNAATILGTSNYYDDPEVIPRYQMLEAIESGYYFRNGITYIPSDVLTLVAWAAQPQLDVALDISEYQVLGTSLYLVEIPLRQNLVNGRTATLPLQLLNWIPRNVTSSAAAPIEKMYLSDGLVEFEYTPWPEFSQGTVTALRIMLTSLPEETLPPPDLALWNWQTNAWEDQATSWGETAVPHFTPYIGPQNTVRFRLTATSSGVEIQTVYPQLTITLTP